MRWEPLAREVIGTQLAKAADSIGANIAEAYGRFHFGEKLQFLYYARGSLFETKYWLNRVQARGLLSSGQVQDYASQLTNLARQLNGFAATLKAQRQGGRSPSPAISEMVVEYVLDHRDDIPLFTDEDLQWLQATLNT